MISDEDWNSLEATIKKYNKFIITTHINPDGDGIGSELGIFWILKKLGKDVLIINDSPTPQFYKFLDPKDELIKQYDEKYCEIILKTDVVILMDISNSERLGRLSEIIKRSDAIKVVIDHHHCNSGWGDVNIVDENASASGEIVYNLVKRFGLEIDLRMATDLYVAILTDTGSFRFSNTNKRAHFICGELLEKGINPREIYGHIYESYSWERMILFSKSLSSIRKIAGGKVSSIYITVEMMETSGAKREDIEGFVEYITTLKDVEIAILFLELSTRKVKVSLRSKLNYDVNKIAEVFGGGGHKNASGIVFKDSTLEEAQDMVFSEVEKVVK
ncbi:bifunctional oligoribonuclease/PAP phosphatase NrnA [candidate division KSB1 bacterium]